MSTEAPAKEKDGTWRAWVPNGFPEPAPDDMLTRAELLEELRGRGIDIPERTLKFWQTRGLLPKPTRHWRDNATRSLYPDFYPRVVAYLHGLQAAGTPMRQLAPLVRAYALSSIGWEDPLRPPLDKAGAAAAELARAVERYTGGLRIVEAELRFRDETGRVVETHTWPVAPDA